MENNISKNNNNNNNNKIPNNYLLIIFIKLIINYKNKYNNLIKNISFMSALRALLSATNPYSTSFPGINEPVNNNSIDCCICLCHIGPFQALFIAPCSHCFHYKCINPIICSSGDMFLCPVCRQVANLKASVSSDSLFDNDDDELLEEDKIHSVDSPSMLSSTPVNTISNIPHAHNHSTLVSNSMPSHHVTSSNITSDVVSSPPAMSSPINELSNANQQISSLINNQNASTPITELQNMNISENNNNSSNENITENQPFHVTENMNTSNVENNNEPTNETGHYSPMPSENMVIDSSSNNDNNNS